MACCGQNRQQMRIQPTAVRQPDNPAKVAGSEESLIHQQGTKFQYVGETALTAIGLPSRRLYRFAHPGAVVLVDPRDIASLAAVPNLRQI
jgi:hypothetical protein